MITHKKSAQRKLSVPIIVGCAVLLLLITVVTVTLIKSKSDVILSGVTAGGTDLSNMTVEEAASAIS